MSCWNTLNLKFWHLLKESFKAFFKVKKKGFGLLLKNYVLPNLKNYNDILNRIGFMIKICGVISIQMNINLSFNHFS